MADNSVRYPVSSGIDSSGNVQSGAQTITAPSGSGLTLKGQVAASGATALVVDNVTLQSSGNIAVLKSGGVTQITIAAADGSITSAGGNFVARSTSYGHVFFIGTDYGQTIGYDMKAAFTDGASACAFRLNTNSAITSGNILRIANNAVDKLTVGPQGKITYPTGAADSVVGKSVLVGGTVTVSTTAVTASSIILLTRQVTGGTAGDLRVGTVTAATSFVINSASGTDTSTVSWLIFN